MFNDIQGHYAISIHAPRIGSDDFYIVTIIKVINFNPRSPYRERQ